MIKRLTTAIVLALILVAGVPAARARTVADGADGSGGQTGSTSSIWEGLCVGASLDLSRASQAKCALQAQAAQHQDNSFVDNQPNIGASLCVGASLDLSKASQARCVRQTPPPPNAPGAASTHSMNGGQFHQTPHKHQRAPNNSGTVTTTPPTPPSPVQYAALGDSIAAGLGLSGAANSTADVCGRTLGSYVYQVANSRGLEVTNFACSGARMTDLTKQQSVSGPNPAAQLDSAFAGGTPQLITITAGANDVRWVTFLRKCYSMNCGTPFDERSANNLIAKLQVKTQAVLQQIQQRSAGSPPEVILTGYYMPLSDRCAQIEPRLTPDEISWLDAKTALLNEALKNATQQSGFATFVPVDFTGHDICSSDPWVQTLDDPAPFHPTLRGQQAIAQAIIN